MKILHNKQNRKKGFTLVEVLITVVILGILLAISTVALVHYVNQLKLTEMDVTAREIFVTAQNHLTSVEATGVLDNYKVKKSVGLGSQMSVKPTDMDNSKFDWPESAKDNKYYYLVYDSSYTNELSSSMLKYMLPFGSIDDTVRSGGSYVIEYDAETMNIYSVFYTDSGQLTYGDIEKLNDAGARNNDESGRAARTRYKSDHGTFTVGYYGGAMADSLDVSTTKSFDMEVYNKDQLKVVIKDYNYYLINNGQQYNTQVTFNVKGTSSEASRKFTLGTTKSGNSVIKSDNVTMDSSWWSVSSEQDIKGNKYLKYELILDDITRKGGHFIDIFNVSNNNGQKFEPGEDLELTATCSSNNVLMEDLKVTKSVNSLFDSIEVVRDDLGKPTSDAIDK